MIRPALRPHHRRGYVLYIVLVVVVVLTLVAYQYSDSMASEAGAAVRAHELEQAKANAVSGVYVAAAVVWGWLVEGQVPDRWDLSGAAVALIGVGIIAFGPR